jgi:hypothetical protein
MINACWGQPGVFATVSVLRAFTSLDRDEFAMLLLAFEQAWEASVTHRFRHRKTRKRHYGGGRKPRLLAIEDKLLFIPPHSP